MKFRGMSILVVGLARTGLALLKVLGEKGARIIANDLKTADKLNIDFGDFEKYNIQFKLGEKPDLLIDSVDLIVISPSVPIGLPFVSKAKAKGIEVISEIELSYRLCKCPIIAITGTNGKTTTTSLTGEIFKAAGKNTHVVGNIGIPFIEKAVNTDEDDVVIAEISSFQLEGIEGFHPSICSILNITPDHLDRHKTMKSYIETKKSIYKNTNENDFIILNKDDEVTSRVRVNTNADVLYWSTKTSLKKGAFVEEGYLVADIGYGKQRIIKTEDIFIPGEHNLQNAMAAVLMAMTYGIDINIISNVLRDFRGVEHRIEFVDTINGVAFYNDSKGTNPDASIRAVNAMRGSTVLIAGGYNKGASYKELINSFNGRVSHMIVLGETADDIVNTAIKCGFDKNIRVNDIDEAVKTAFKLADKGSSVLLSPACASWDMFDNYEQRGRIFKESVMALKGGN